MPYFKPDGTQMTPEEVFMMKLDLKKTYPYYGKPDCDPFSTRYGYMPGRCNAYRRINGRKREDGALCRQWPGVGRKRCRRHDPWWKRKL